MIERDHKNMNKNACSLLIILLRLTAENLPTIPFTVLYVQFIDNVQRCSANVGIKTRRKKHKFYLESVMVLMVLPSLAQLTRGGGWPGGGLQDRLAVPPFTTQLSSGSSRKVVFRSETERTGGQSWLGGQKGSAKAWGQRGPGG